MSHGFIKIFSLAIIVVGIVYRAMAPHFGIEEMKNENHSHYVMDNLFSQEEFSNFSNHVKTIPFEMTINADPNAGDSYGSSPIGSDGKCSNQYQYPSPDKTRCIVPARLDVVYHLMFTGGYNAKKEYSKRLQSRGLIFHSLLFSRKNQANLPEMMRLFESEDYQKKAREICEGRPILDPFQVSFIINIPGQELAMHYDAPWFHGGDKLNLPGWLLVVMQKSGLFEEHRIPQVQGVTYVHEWKDVEQAEGGIYYYPKGPGGQKIVVPAIPNRALIMDGNKIAHATQTFRPKSKNQFPLDKNEDYLLKHNGKDWDLFHKKTMEKLKTFQPEELRISLVWRQRCFASEEEKVSYHKNINQSRFEVREVIDKLLDNLIRQGKIKQKPNDEIETIKTLIRNYIHYPYPDSYFPYNFCILAEALPWLKPVADLVCS